jgi:hypothetical protein
MRHEADGPAQLDKGQSFLAQVEDGLEADLKKRSDFFCLPKLRIRRWLIRFPGKRLLTGMASYRWRIHRDVFWHRFKKHGKGYVGVRWGYVRAMRAHQKIVSKRRPELTLRRRDRIDRVHRPIMPIFSTNA